jgi:hypothetical protein
MRYVSIFKIAADRRNAPPSEKEIDQMGKLISEMINAGVLIDTGGVMPGGSSLRVRRENGNVSVTDGPFAEAKEVIGGYAVMEVASKDELLSWMRRFLDIAGDGTAEVLEVAAPPSP